MLEQSDGHFDLLVIQGDAAQVTGASLVLSGKLSAYLLGSCRQVQANPVQCLDSAITWQGFCGLLQRKWPEDGKPQRRHLPLSRYQQPLVYRIVVCHKRRHSSQDSYQVIA